MSNVDKIGFSAHFKDTKKEMPIVSPKQWTVAVYFICENILYRGEYHQNGCFYAYRTTSQFDCFASKDGVSKTWNGTSKNKICTHWCYVDELNKNQQ